MNLKILFPTAFILGAIFSFKNENPTSQERKGKLQYDTSSAKLKSFKLFSKHFFTAIKAHDSSFLKAHIIFPIANSSFYIFEKNLLHKTIDSRIFFSGLNKLFPTDLIKRMDKEGKFAFSVTKGAPKNFTIEIYDTTGKIEGNYTWIFTQKGDDFYFETFRAEAG
jgi:hypothetical protein